MEWLQSLLGNLGLGDLSGSDTKVAELSDEELMAMSSAERTAHFNQVAKQMAADQSAGQGHAQYGMTQNKSPDMSKDATASKALGMLGATQNASNAVQGGPRPMNQNMYASPYLKSLLGV